MIINDKRSLHSIQSEFTRNYPFLKIEFYKTAHMDCEGSTEKERWDSPKTIGEIRKKHNSGEMKIRDNMSVSELEKTLCDNFGLYAQVFRRSGSIWLQTTASDHWTLEEQNRKGRVSVKGEEKKDARL
jgi:hypothetical protein